MSWLLSFLVSFLTGALALVCGGLVMNACVGWYRISSFEGGSGYAVIFAALLSGIAGLVIGLVTARLVAAGSSPGFWMGLGCAWGIVLLLAGIVAATSRLLADVAPEIDGHSLDLEVEIRLPVDATNAPAALAAAADPKESHLTLGSVVNHAQRRSHRGTLRPEDSRREDGRWIVPGSVRLFTERGYRGIDAVLGGKPIAGFLLPVPARPGRAQEDWSPWYPQPPAGQPAWPDTKPSIRYRVRQVIPPPVATETDPRVAEAEAFEALPPDAPLTDVLPFLDFQSDSERIRAVMKSVKARPAELVEAIRSTDLELRQHALQAVMNLDPIPPEIVEATAGEGRSIADAVRLFHHLPADHPTTLAERDAIRARYARWERAWWVTIQRTGVDGRPPIREILEFAEVRGAGTQMDEIAAGARGFLDELEPKKTPAP